MMDPVHNLVVDDEETIRFFLKETLQRAGHTVVTASSGEEALDRLRETPFDLIMLDLRLGGRVDGLRVLEAVKWRWPQTVVIILTGYGSLESAMAAIREGVDGYLLKPVEPQEVRQAVQEALERRERLACPQEIEEGVLQSGPFSVDLNKHLVRRAALRSGHYRLEDAGHGRRRAYTGHQSLGSRCRRDLDNGLRQP